MRKINFFYLFAFIATLAISVTSCDDDDSSCEDFCPEGSTCINGVCTPQDQVTCEDICVDGTCDDNGNCVIEMSDGTMMVEINGNIDEDQTWTADNIYVLTTRVAVTAGNTLTIEPGTVIKAQAGQGADAKVLVVARDAQIIAEGEAQLPIIFTSVADEITPTDVANGNFSSTTPSTLQGLWGGVIILGNAPISAQNENDEDVTELQIEGIPTSDANGLYGGNDKEDNSGILKYVSIRHGGTDLGSGNEINGLSLGGVGSATVLENIEIVANKDDGIEWFGGTVDATNVLVWGCGDDGLDTDQAWNGTCSNFIVAIPQGGSAFELDGPEGSYIDGPHQFTNGVVYAGENIDHLVDWDGNTNAGLNDIYFFGISEEYMATEDFDPIETFGGDGTGNNGNWEYTLPAGLNAENVFTGVPSEALIEVSGPSSKTVGPNASDFSWAWGGHAGVLSSLGL